MCVQGANRLTAALTAWLLLLVSVCGVGAAELPSAVVPAGLGVNVFFTSGGQRDLDMIQAAGGKYVRVDAYWHNIEKTKGRYDFSSLDRLYDDCAARGIRILLILCYGNRLYSDSNVLYGVSPESPAWRQGFANYAVAMAKHFKGKTNKPIYEFWNEPNNGFWPGGANVNQYMSVARQVLPAMRAADPNVTIIAPASSGIDFPFLTNCFQQGLLNLVDAVSVHPYTAANGTPETRVTDYTSLRNRINQHKPGVPIISSEWGYATGAPGITPQAQANNLARMFLVNLSQGIPLSIWFDWNDLTKDQNDPNLTYGIATTELEPKPAYHAMQLLTKSLEGTSFTKRLPSPSSSSPEQDWLLVFTSPNGRKTLAVWTTETPHTVNVPGWGPMDLTRSPSYHRASP